MMKNEVWKDIEGYEGKYQISNFGRVKSLSRKIKNCETGYRKTKDRILKSQINNTGYPYVHLSNSMSRKLKLIHRLVAEAFIPNPKNKPEINHKNLNKLDHSIENLEWVTSSENSYHAVKSGAMDHIIAMVKIMNKGQSFSHKNIIVIKKENNSVHEFKSARDASRYFNQCLSYFSELINKQNGENYKFIARYKVTE